MLRTHFLLIFTCCVLQLGELRGQDKPAKFTDAQLEHFEKRIRPLLAKRCFECHSSKSKKLQGELRIDSRVAMLAGGDSGPAFEPGKPDESLLIQAIRYDGDYKMPPKGKLPEAEIKLLEAWVAAGAPWPKETASKPGARSNFDLLARRAEHWAWQPLKPGAVPANTTWSQRPIDRYVFRRLEENKLKPNQPTSRSALIRRLYFDLIGLPPTPDKVKAFVQDRSPKAVEKVVDELLSSHHFGERWARHWMDLTRYAESRGHEFDYNAPNAFEYRDYLIRALNRDVPYDKLVVEHIAGDLLDKPRVNGQGINESIIGTAFWHLGEWCHSPVDVRQDEADRNDNMIDVFGKTFLAMTIACARCHDHKFDAISQRDYYAMSGFLQSSSFRLARFETLAHNQGVLRKIALWRDRTSRAVSAELRKSLTKDYQQWGPYFAAAIDVLKAPEDTSAAKPQAGERVLFDFEKGTYEGWKVEGSAFGDKPQTQQTIASYQGNVQAKGKFFVNSHNKRKRGRGDNDQGKLTSKEFEVTHRYLSFLVGGGSHAKRTCVNVLCDGRAVASVTGRNSNQMSQVTVDLQRYLGAKAIIEIVDQQKGGWGNIGADHFVLSDRHVGTVHAAQGFPQRDLAPAIARVAGNKKLDREWLAAWVHALAAAEQDKTDAMHVIVKFAHGDSAPMKALQTKDATTRELKLDGRRVISDFRGKNGKWFSDGPGFGMGVRKAGSLKLEGTSEKPEFGIEITGSARTEEAFDGLKLKPGSMSNSGRLGGWKRAGRLLKTPTFEIKDGWIHWLVRGSGRVHTVVDSHYMINGPLHGETMKEWKGNGQWMWVSQNVRLLKGHRAHVEIAPLPGKPLEVLAVVEGGDKAPSLPNFDSTTAFQPLWSAKVSKESIAQQHLSELKTALEKTFRSKPTTVNERMIASWGLRHYDALLNPARGATLLAKLKPLWSEYESLKGTVKNESKVTLAMWDGTGEDEYVFVRGSHRRSAGEAPRQLLSAIVGDDKRVSTAGSGRLELAHDVINPKNPLTARVAVNRLWHHLFGRGIVASVDNFGVLGEKPSHPELLDYLAQEFMNDEWSIKRMLRRLVLTKTYQMSSKVNPAQEEKDPDDIWLHRMRVKRLEGEVIRDTILATSGRLNLDPYEGPSIPVHLTAFMTGRGRPRSGPLDGDGRRSVFLSVRRNFLSPMMLAFDMPQPFSSMGRRTVSNVPAQALILMNDPLVVAEAGRWAKKTLAGKGSVDQRIQQMYEQAFARSASSEELAAAKAFLKEQAKRHGNDDWKSSESAWTDLCHVLFNVKEFIYIP